MFGSDTQAMINLLKSILDVELKLSGSLLIVSNYQGIRDGGNVPASTG